MRIELKNIKPTVTVGFFNPDSDIWEHEIVFEPGKYNLINSPSGRGKSSLVAFIYGTRIDYTGQVFLDGRDNKTLNFTNWSHIRTKQLSIVFQDLRLFPTLTGMENILVKSMLTNDVQKDEIMMMAEKLKVAPLLGKMCKHMSFGEQQRVAIIRSLCQPFEYLLMDEPFSHLDKGNISIACELIKEKCLKNNAGLILTTLGEHYEIDYDQIKSV